MNINSNADAWGHTSILNYFDRKRATTQDVYPSEWFFLQQKLRNGMSMLDIGCAKGGMANVLNEHVKDFSYLGVDINAQMVEEAKKRYPQHRFLQVHENNYTVLGDETHDLVLCLGILHLHETWRETLAMAWKHTRGSLIFDLRETHLSSIEDKAVSYFKIDFDNVENPSSNYTLPYNVINASEAQKTVMDICRGASKLTHYGYLHPVSGLAVGPISQVMANVYCVERASA